MISDKRPTKEAIAYQDRLSSQHGANLVKRSGIIYLTYDRNIQPKRKNNETVIILYDIFSFCVGKRYAGHETLYAKNAR